MRGSDAKSRADRRMRDEFAVQDYIVRCLTGVVKRVSLAQRQAIAQYMALCKQSRPGGRE